VVAVDATQIAHSGKTNLTDYLIRIPALAGSFGGSNAAGGNTDIGIGETGLNLLNLRYLGTDRTLVLIDGRRQVGAEAGSAAVDINTIPLDLVERVDVLTGGASATYGADAVTGVVNFVLKKNFEGLSIRGQNGWADRGKGGERFFAATFGKNFADGRGNISLAYEFGQEDRTPASARGYISGSNAVTFHECPEGTNCKYSRVPIHGARFFDTARQGAIDVDLYTQDGYGPELLSNGNPYDPGTFVPPFYQLGGSGTLQRDYAGDLRAKLDRHIFNVMTHYDVSDALTLYAEAKYVHISTFSVSQPTFDYYLRMREDNPFIPSALRTAIGGAFAANQLQDPSDPSTGFVWMNRDNFDLGQRGERITRDTLRGVLGAKGQLTPHLRYDASFEYSQNKIKNRLTGDQLTDRFLAAIDAVPDGHGGVTCRINTIANPTQDDIYQPDADPSNGGSRTLRGGPLTFAPGTCVPLNLFGVGMASQAAKDFISVDTVERTKLTQQVFSAALSGDTGGFFKLPGGPIGFAVGAEYRRETSKDIPDDFIQQGLTFSNLSPIAKGKFDVYEGFAEIDAPILKDVPFAQLLDFNAAVRFSHYSTIGNTTTWRFSGQWAPVRDIKFRGTIAQAVRAPNISELFGPNGQDFEFIDDPCAGTHVNEGKAVRPANCAALLTSLGVANPGGFTDLNSASISGSSGGNPNLKAETAKTWTAGVVLTPRFAPGLNISADWYNIKLKQAINNVDPQQLADLCVDQPTLNNVFCSQITRQNGGPQAGRILTFVRQPQNVAQFLTSGLDIDINYLMRTDKAGTFNFHLVGNYLHELKQIGVPGAAATDFRGTYEYPAPKYLVNFDASWAFKKLTLAYNLAWYSHVLRYTHDQINSDPDFVAPKYKYIKARFEHDIQASYDFNEMIQVYGGINNFTDQKPDLGQIRQPVEPQGRFFYIGAKVKLARVF
jgi:iron complex outermembrane receptor protein